jgi:hypothetical protein
MGTLNAPAAHKFKGPRPACLTTRGVPGYGGAGSRHFASGDRTFSMRPVHIGKGAAMTQADHYRDQSNRARRLARAVNDPEASKKLNEMAEEFRLYAERLEQTH